MLVRFSETSGTLRSGRKRTDNGEKVLAELDKALSKMGFYAEYDFADFADYDGETIYQITIDIKRNASSGRSKK